MALQEQHTIRPRAHREPARDAVDPLGALLAAARGELDAETDNFGSVPSLDAPPAAQDHPSSGPLDDLLAIIEGDDGDPTL